MVHLTACKFSNRVITFGLNNGRSKTVVVNISTPLKTFKTFYQSYILPEFFHHSIWSNHDDVGRH